MEKTCTALLIKGPFNIAKVITCPPPAPLAANRLRPTKIQVTLIIFGFFVNFFQVASMKLSLDHLVMLQSLSEVDSITAVAERLWVTPSAVSHRIREAERRLGVKLSDTKPGAR